MMILKKFKVKNSKKLKYFLVVTPTFVIVINFLYSFYENNIFLDLQISFLLKITSTLLLIGFLRQVGKLVSFLFELENISLSIVVFLLSFFVVDNIFLFFTKEISFNFHIFIISIFWILLALYKKFPIQKLVLLLLNYFVLILFNNLYYPRLINTVSAQSTDIAEFWEPTMKNILNNNYFYALENNLIEGYGLLVSYIQATVNIFSMGKIIVGYEQTSSGLYVYFLLFLLFLLELEISTSTKFIAVITTISIILNSTWLRFLFVESLMGEAVVSLIFTILIYDISINKINQRSPILYLIFGSLFLSKQFIILISILIVLAEFVFKKNKKILIFSPFVYLINRVYKQYFFENQNGISYLDNNSVYDLFNYYFIQNNLMLNNIIEILKIISIDRVFVFFIFILFFSYLVNLKEKPFRDYLSISILSNTLLVILLYISYWQNIEIESAYRYILNLMYIFILKYVLIIDNLLNKN
jgi:hypothetical protein